MGLFPTDDRVNVAGLTEMETGYEKYRVPPTCCAPTCTKWTDGAHHLFSRGKMGGAFDYVRVPDGTEIGNLVPLCHEHHRQVTDNEAHITYHNGKFSWDGTPLMWQPPIMKRGEIDVQESSDGHVDEQPVVERPVCQECGRALPRTKPESDGTEERKIRKTWAVSVPYTVEENGADVLDGLLDGAREKMDEHGLDWGRGHKVKYHVLATALALFVQHGDLVLNNGE